MICLFVDFPYAAD